MDLRNYQNRKWKQIRFAKRISKRWAEKIESKFRKVKSQFQSWKLNQFGKLMRYKWNSL